MTRSDTGWKHTVHPGYSNSTSGTQVNFRLPESNVYYDARAATVMSGWHSPGFDTAGAAPWNGLVEPSCYGGNRPVRCRRHRSARQVASGSGPRDPAPVGEFAQLASERLGLARHELPTQRCGPCLGIP